MVRAVEQEGDRSNPSRDLITAGHQAVTRQWWENQRPLFDCFVSAVVLDEIQQGDPRMAAKRLESLAGVPVLEITEATGDLIREIMASGVLPPRAARDAAHVAVATTGGVDYLITWNCRHIANAKIETRLRTICENAGWRLPVLCTPEELMGDDEEGDVENA